MHHKLLLGSTALVSASVLLASASPASAQMEVSLTGYTEFGMNFAEDDGLTGSDRGYGAFMDTEIHTLANAVSDSGVEYGGKVELEVFNDRSAAGAGSTSADEAVIFMSGNFGRVELGREDGAEDVMFVGGEDVAAGTGGFDGDTTNLIPLQIQDTSDAAKITYFTPRIAGFQLGASWTPDTGDDFGDDSATGPGGDLENSFGFGANWTGEFSGLEMTVSGAGNIADAESAGADDVTDFSVGVNTSFFGASFGAAYIARTDRNEADIFNVGLGYGFGPVNTSIGYVYHDPDVGTEQSLLAVSADVGILPGVVLKGDVTYNSDDLLEDTFDDTEEETFAGVVTVQLNY